MPYRELELTDGFGVGMLMANSIVRRRDGGVCEYLFTGAAALLLGALANTSIAAPASAQQEALDEHRERFIAARASLTAGHREPFRAAIPGLADYALHDWLIFEELADRWGMETPGPGTLAILADFKERTPDPALVRRLARTLQQSLARGDEWARYLAIEKSEYGVEMPCTTLRARAETGQLERLDDAAIALWIKPGKRDAMCRDVLAALVDRDTPPIAAMWERVYAAMDANDYSAAKEVLRWLGTADRNAVNGWIDAVDAPGEYLQGDALSTDTPFNRRAIADLVLRWSRDDTVAAVDWWRENSARFGFYADRYYDTHRALVMRAALRRMPEAGEWLGEFKARADDLEIMEWRVRAALTKGDWLDVMRYLYRLPEEERKEDHWAYWEARALEVAGHIGPATTIYQELAGLQSWHGFLSADRLGQDYVLYDEPIEPDAGVLAALFANPLAQRAREFFAVGMPSEGRRVWTAVLAKASKPELTAAAVLAKQWGMEDRAIFTAGRAEQRRALSYRFPVLYRSEVATAAAEHQIEPAWIFGIMRRESAFIPDVVSSARAVGLMQLLPRTADYVAELQKKPDWGGDLTRPDVNIDFGTFYIGYVQDKFDGHRALATASYNAGPTRVKSWLPEQDMEADRWIDTIPFTETRRYVRAVLAYAAIYEHQLTGVVTPITQRLPTVPAKEPTVGSALGSDQGKS